MSDKVKAELLEQHHLMQLAPKLPARHDSIRHAINGDKFFVSLMRKAGPAMAFVAGDQVIGAAGLIDYPGTGRAVIWCAFAEGHTEHFLGMVNMLKNMKTFYPRGRYEAHIDPEFTEAQRLVKLAGFTCEAPLMKDFDGPGLHKQLWALTPEVSA